MSGPGKVRLALNSAGLDAKEVTGAQMIVVLKRVLPGELKARGVEAGEEVCSTIASRMAGMAAAAAAPGSSVEDVFRRLGGR